VAQVRELCSCPYEELNLSLLTGLGVNFSIFLVMVLKANLAMGQLRCFIFFFVYPLTWEFFWFPSIPKLLSNRSSDCLLGLIVFWGS